MTVFRLLSPVLILAIWHRNKGKIKRLLLLAALYAVIIFVIKDFESVVDGSVLILLKTTKWLVLVIALFHISLAMRNEKGRGELSSDQEVAKSIKSHEPTKLLTKSQKIINKYRK